MSWYRFQERHNVEIFWFYIMLMAAIIVAYFLGAFG